MAHRLIMVGLLASLASAASPAFAVVASPYDRDLISVVTLGRHGDFPTANCLVWANAEDLGVGPGELGGYHGLTMNINPKPLASEAVQKPTSFEAGFAEMRARFPTAPAWLLKTVEKNRAAIEMACSEDHETPSKIYAITSRDTQP